MQCQVAPLGLSLVERRRLLQCVDECQFKSSPHWLLIARPGEKIGASNLQWLVDAGSKITACYPFLYSRGYFSVIITLTALAQEW